MGRPPKPTALKKLAGTIRPSRVKNEPKPDGHAAAPEWLEPAARAEWDRLVPELDRLGLATSADRALLVTYCIAWADFVEASEHIAKEGRIVTGANGVEGRNVWGKVKTDAIEVLIKVSAHFGLSPSTRARLDVPAAEMKDSLDEFLEHQRFFGN